MEKISINLCDDTIKYIEELKHYLSKLNKKPIEKITRTEIIEYCIQMHWYKCIGENKSTVLNRIHNKICNKIYRKEVKK